MSLLLTLLLLIGSTVSDGFVLSLCCRLVNENKTVLRKLSFFFAAYLHHYCAAIHATAAFIATRSIKTLVYLAGLYLQAIVFVSVCSLVSHEILYLYLFDRISPFVCVYLRFKSLL